MSAYLDSLPRESRWRAPQRRLHSICIRQIKGAVNAAIQRARTRKSVNRYSSNNNDAARSRRCGVPPQPAFNSIPLQLHPALTTLASPPWARPPRCRRDVPSGGEMPRFEFIMIMRRAEVRLTILERPAFLLRLPLFFLYFVLLRPSPSPPPVPFSFAFSSTDSRRFVPLSIVNVPPEHRRISFLSRYSFFFWYPAILLSNHRFVSIHSLFVHSESSALIAEVKWDSGKQNRGCAPTPELLFQWTLARLHSAVSLSMRAL